MKIRMIKTTSMRVGPRTTRTLRAGEEYEIDGAEARRLFDAGAAQYLGADPSAPAALSAPQIRTLGAIADQAALMEASPIDTLLAEAAEAGIEITVADFAGFSDDEVRNFAEAKGVRVGKRSREDILADVIKKSAGGAA